ncbi:MAG: AMP-binding protein [Deltaproteobacteria bacterium]
MEEKEEMAIDRSQAPFEKLDPETDTIPTLFWRRVPAWGNRTAMREKVFGIWRDVTWRQYGDKVRNVTMGLAALGLESGDRVAIASENNPAWLYADQGILSAGGLTAGIYPTDSASQVEYITNHCAAKFFIAENEEQLDKILEIRHSTPSVQKIIVIDMEGLRHFSDPSVISFDELLDIGEEFDRNHEGRLERLRQVPRPEDPAILIYTSGTTGPPKAAMLSHKNILHAVDSLFQVMAAFPTDEVLTFLPLCHVAERVLSGFGPLYAGYTINFAEELDTIPENLREVSPTIFLAVPRFWEKFYSALVLRIKDSTALERLAFRWATSIGGKVSDYRLRAQEPPLAWKALFTIANWTVLKNVKKFIGLDRARWCLSGAAPISPDLLKFFHSLGVNVREV